jgi:1-acyl-sn-glycerol-3-phosphate acyltransferase
MLINVLCAASHVLCTKFLGWNFVGDRPEERKVMLLGAPHTSNLDYFLTLGLIHHWQLPLRYLVKDNIFKGPMALLLRSLGGIPVDRSKTNKLVDSMISTIKDQDEIAMGVLPEGTRKYVDYWKSGFYYIAVGAEIPIYPVLVNGGAKTVVMGPRLQPSGDLDADMVLLKEFFGDTKGVKPEKSGPVRVRPRKQKDTDTTAE